MGQESEKAIVHGIGIVQIINITKNLRSISVILDACILPPPEVTSHTLFKDGDVMNILEEFWYHLCKESGVPQATISDICSGKTSIEKCSAETIFRIARVLNVSMES